MIEKQKSKLEPKFKLAENFIDLKTSHTNVIIEQLEQNIQVREMSIEQQLKNKIAKQLLH